jgi:hypothetical protein
VPEAEEQPKQEKPSAKSDAETETQEKQGESVLRDVLGAKPLDKD